LTEYGIEIDDDGMRRRRRHRFRRADVWRTPRHLGCGVGSLVGDVM
jgi:hypothetical protein